MPSGAEDAGPSIGTRLNEIRKGLGLTLAQAGQLSSVSMSMLSRIENGQVSPSFDVIKKVCDAFDVSLEDLVRPGPKPLVSGRKAITRAGAASEFTSGQYDYRAHATELAQKGMVPFEMRIRARSPDDFDHWSQHAGEEFVYVLSGEIEIHTECYTPFRLKRGESAYFDSGMRHLYVSVGERDAEVLSVSCDPEQKGRREPRQRGADGRREVAAGLDAGKTTGAPRVAKAAR